MTSFQGGGGVVEGEIKFLCNLTLLSVAVRMVLWVGDAVGLEERRGLMGMLSVASIMAMSV